MTRNNYLFAALCLLAGGLASCSSNIDDELPANDTWTLNVMATKSDTPATRALSEDGTATWASGEKVDVMYNSETRGTLTPQAYGDKLTTLSGTITGTDYYVNVDESSTLTLWFPKYAGATISYLGQYGTLADIAARFDYAHANVSVTSVDASNHVLTTTNATFVNAQAIVKFTLYDKANNSLLSVNRIQVSDGSSEIANTKALDSPISEGVVWLAIPPVSSKYITLTVTSGGNSYTYTTPSATSFVAGHFYPINVKMTLVPAS